MLELKRFFAFLRRVKLLNAGTHGDAHQFIYMFIYMFVYIVEATARSKRRRQPAGNPSMLMAKLRPNFLASARLANALAAVYRSFTVSTSRCHTSML